MLKHSLGNFVKILIKACIVKGQSQAEQSIPIIFNSLKNCRESITGLLPTPALKIFMSLSPQIS
jgi:hypothetical protein